MVPPAAAVVLELHSQDGGAVAIRAALPDMTPVQRLMGRRGRAESDLTSLSLSISAFHKYNELVGAMPRVLLGPKAVQGPSSDI